MSFINRTAAGRWLAGHLLHLRGEDVVVLALPRGGVPVAFEVAQALAAPLDIIVVRKLGVPAQPELAMGAIGEDDVCVLNKAVLRRAQVSAKELATVQRREQAELRRRAKRFRGNRARQPLTGRTALLIDDGIATGATARAACRIARAQGAQRVVLATPIGSRDSVAELRREADEVVCPQTARWFLGIGQWYADFSQVRDEEVVELLRRAEQALALRAATGGAAGGPYRLDEAIDVPIGSARFTGKFTVPHQTATHQTATHQTNGIVVFTQSGGSVRHRAHDQYLADVLHGAGLGTLQGDSLARGQELNPADVADGDVELSASRLIEVSAWLRTRSADQSWRIGYLGTNTSTGTALWAAAEPQNDVAAIVSWSGRPDLAAARLPDVRAPTLLIVGDRDDAGFKLNRQAQARLRCENRLVVIPGATHLFVEPGALAAVARHARDWFISHLLPVAYPSGG